MFREQDLAVMVSTCHHQDPFVVTIESWMVSLPLYDASGRIEGVHCDERTREIESAFACSLFGAIFETSQCMIGTMYLSRVDEVIDVDRHCFIKVWIVGMK